MQGRIDVVRPDGLIEGWCWNEERPDSRVSVTVLIDGIEVGSCLAAQYREDLRLAKIGDGFYAFSFVTQTPPSSDNRTQTYTLIETDSRSPVGDPLIVQNKQAISFDSRLIELETQNRLLTSRLEELLAHNSQTSSSELFAVVGEFFSRLSKDMQRGEPLGITRRMCDIVDAVTSAHRPIILKIPERSAMTILVHACSSLVHTHACLTSLQRAGVEELGTIVVLDSGQAQDAILIPSITRGIRYVRTIAELTLEWSDAERGEVTDTVIMLSGATIVHTSFLREIAAGLAHNSNAAAIGPHIVSTGAVPCGGGLYLRGGTLKDCVKTGHPEPKVDLRSSYPIHALSSQAVAFRRSALRAVGGLDAVFGNDLEAAVIDLCLRLRHRGWSVLVQPSAIIELQGHFENDGLITHALAGYSGKADILRARWLDSPMQPPLFAGHAAVLGMPGSFHDELMAVRRLRERDYSVEYIGPESLSPELASELQRAGATLSLSPDVGVTLRNCDAAFIYTAGTSPVLQLIPEGRLTVIGNMALKQTLSDDHGMDVLSDPLAFAEDERPRQVAGS